jgi:hypothetical protein
MADTTHDSVKALAVGDDADHVQHPVSVGWHSRHHTLANRCHVGNRDDPNCLWGSEGAITRADFACHAVSGRTHLG